MKKKNPLVTLLLPGEPAVDLHCNTDKLKALRKIDKDKKVKKKKPKRFTLEEYEDMLKKQKVEKLIYR